MDSVQGEKPPASLPVDQWKTWTYGEFVDESKRAANAFIKMGLQPFDAVTIYGFNHPAWHGAAVSDPATLQLSSKRFELGGRWPLSWLEASVRESTPVTLLSKSSNTLHTCTPASNRPTGIRPTTPGPGWQWFRMQTR